MSVCEPCVLYDYTISRKVPRHMKNKIKICITILLFPDTVHRISVFVQYVTFNGKIQEYTFEINLILC